MREILMMGGERQDGYFYIVGLMTCQNEIMDALETSSGKEWSVGRVDVEEVVREGKLRMEKGFFDGAMMLLERSALFGKLDDVETRQKGKLGQKGNDSVGKVVEQMLMELARNGEADCGCG